MNEQSSSEDHVAPHQAGPEPSVAVVTPFFCHDLGDEGELALAHLEHHLGGYHRYFFAPPGLDPGRAGYRVVRFPADCFESVETYSRLLLSPEFYRAFADYDYILIYQLDCLVFSDALRSWCRSGYDYVGAPWLRDPASPEKGFSRVGNGGLSLRRVRSCLRVLESDRYVGRPVSFLRDLLRAPLPDLADEPWPTTLGKRVRVLREARLGASAYAARYSLNEDHFWSDRARLFVPDFRIAPVEVGLRFAFERAPRYCCAANGGRLPFGCHAWSRWDRSFWEPHLLTRESR